MKTPKELISDCFEYGKLNSRAFLPMICLSDLHLMRLELRLSEQEDSWLFDLIENEIKNKLNK